MEERLFLKLDWREWLGLDWREKDGKQKCADVQSYGLTHLEDLFLQP